jgi:hypothetical protein
MSFLTTPLDCGTRQQGSDVEQRLALAKQCRTSVLHGAARVTFLFVMSPNARRLDSLSPMSPSALRVLLGTADASPASFAPNTLT